MEKVSVKTKTEPLASPDHSNDHSTGQDKHVYCHNVPRNKANINNNAQELADPNINQDANVTHFRDAAYGDVPIDVREEAVHDITHEESCSDVNTCPQAGGVSVSQFENYSNSRRTRQSSSLDSRDTKMQETKLRKLPVQMILKKEQGCDEPPVYNDIAMDPLSNYKKNIARSFENIDATQTITLSSEGGTVIKKTVGEQHTADDDNTQILLVYVDDNSTDESTLLVEENNGEMSQENKTATTLTKLGESVYIKKEPCTEKPQDVSVVKTVIFKSEDAASAAADSKMETHQLNEQRKTEMCAVDTGRNNMTSSNKNILVCPPQSTALADRTSVLKAGMSAEVAMPGSISVQQPACGQNMPLESEMIKEVPKHLKQAGYVGLGKQTGENTMMTSDNKVAKSETVTSQFNLFPTEKDVMAAVYQNTAETSHLTNNNVMNSQNSSTSVVSTHSSCTSYIPADLQTNSSYPDTQVSHSKWFASQVNLAAALCVANNSNYQEVHVSSPLLQQRSPQQRNVFSPSCQKDFSQFVLQSPKPNLPANQNISPSILCSPSTNLFDSLMYQSENPFSPSAARADAGRSYSNVQDLDELMAAQQLQQPVPTFQQRQQPCYINNSAHVVNQHINRPPDIGWANMHQTNSLPGVASLLPTASTNNAEMRHISNMGVPPAVFNVRERYLATPALQNMANIEAMRPPKDGMMSCNSGVVMEEYTVPEYHDMLQRTEAVQGHGNRNWNAAPHDERENQSRSSQKSRPRKQNISESSSAPHLSSKQTTSAKATKRSHSSIDHSTASPQSSKKTCHPSSEDDSKGYVNYQIASTIHTLKPRHIVSWYIDFLIKENENITDMSHSYSIPAGIFDDRDFYFMESLLKKMTFPTKKFSNWMQQNFPSININAIDFSEGRRRQNYVMDEAKYWSERTHVDIINEVFYHFQSVRDQK